jgi:hypothetical protein
MEHFDLLSCGNYLYRYLVGPYYTWESPLEILL